MAVVRFSSYMACGLVAAAAAFIPWPARGGPAAKGPALEVPADPALAAIFCGHEGTETSLRYARALNRDLNRLAATGRGAGQALAYVAATTCAVAPNRPNRGEASGLSPAASAP